MTLRFRQTSSLKHILQRSFASTPHRTAEHVRIVEVGPRDGLQNEKKSIPLETKMELIERLARTGVTHMEAGSFVPAKWVPQMESTSEIFQNLLSRPPSSPHPIAYNYLVPNMRGLENLLKLLGAFQSSPDTSKSRSADRDSAPITSTQNPNKMPSREPSPSPSPANEDTDSTPTTSTETPNEMPSTDPSSSSSSSSSSSTTSSSPSPFTLQPEISLFAAATESFSKANTNATIAASLSTCRALTSAAKSPRSPGTPPLRVRGYVSVALGCPYEGPDVPPTRVASIVQSLLECGCDEVSVADTTGMGTAPRTLRLLQALAAAGIRNEDLALHFHDTYGQALVNTVVGLEHGVRVFDASVGGLGGCPYSKGATGNVSTEDLVYLLHSLGMETGVELEEVARVGEWITGVVGRGNEGRAGKAVLARLRG